MDNSRERQPMNTLRDVILGSATGYRSWKVVTRGDVTMGRMAKQYIKPQPGERILDVGCGYGDLSAHLPGVNYVGVDSNDSYISVANRRYGATAEFILGDVSDLSAMDLGAFDAAVAIGVLHHLPDADVTSMLRSISKMLKSSGRFIAAEPVWEPSQRTIARVLTALDRGRFVREEARYEQLVAPWFSKVDSETRHDLFWFPYTHCMITATVDI